MTSEQELKRLEWLRLIAVFILGFCLNGILCGGCSFKYRVETIPLSKEK